MYLYSYRISVAEKKVRERHFSETIDIMFLVLFKFTHCLHICSDNPRDWITQSTRSGDYHHRYSNGNSSSCFLLKSAVVYGSIHEIRYVSAAPSVIHVIKLALLIHSHVVCPRDLTCLPNQV